MLILHFICAYVFILPGAFTNSPKLTIVENNKVKKLVLNAVKDRCSALYDIEPSEIYDTTKVSGKSFN